MNGMGRGGLICVALLLFILIGGGMAHASTYPGEGTQTVPADDEQRLYSGTLTEFNQPVIGEEITYEGSESAFSVSYKPVLLYYALGVLIALAVAYYLIRKYRRKGIS